MSAFREAARQFIESELVCRCGEMNIPGKPYKIRLEEGTLERAGCDNCGKDGRVEEFQRRQPGAKR
jgi:RNase P subunit RPR2